MIKKIENCLICFVSGGKFCKIETRGILSFTSSKSPKLIICFSKVFFI